MHVWVFYNRNDLILLKNTEIVLCNWIIVVNYADFNIEYLSS